MVRPCGRIANMLMSLRIRIMIAALIFPLAWALGVVLHPTTHTVFTILCLTAGSIALAYLVWEYHRAWRLRPVDAHGMFSSGLRNWSGVSVLGCVIRPEDITAALVLLTCAIGIFEYLQISSHPPMASLPTSPPLLLPEAKPLQ